MFFLSKFIPLLIYPLGLVWILVAAALALRKRPAWGRAALWLALVVIWVGGNTWVATALTRALEWRYLPPQEMPQAPVIVVLSGVTYPPDYPRSTVEISGGGDRLIYAAQMYHQGVAPHVLLSGGEVPLVGEDVSGAEDMAELLRLMGVPAEAIWLETRSRNTAENALNSARLLREKGIRQIVLVTSARHMPRAVKLFEAQGLDVTPAPTDYSVTQASWENLWHADFATQFLRLFPTAGNLNRTTGALKELLGIVYAQLMNQ